MKYFIILIIFFPFFILSQGEMETYIKDNAIEVNSIDSLNDKVYSKIKSLGLILVGEMHGTNESAKLAYGLAKLVVKNEGKVSLGIEIPKNEMLDFIKKPSVAELSKSMFFTKKNIDGRNGSAWLALIKNCILDTNIDLFFFDNYSEFDSYGRDKAMYLSVLNQKIKEPKSKIITLSGNIHSKLAPYKNDQTMGSYCFLDSVNFSQSKICSIEHVYSKGEMLNSYGDGLEKVIIPLRESIYSQSVTFNKFLMFYKSIGNQYRCTFYTKEVTPSKVLK